MKTLTVTIEGMHCDGCAETIKALLTLETGVKAANVSYQERRARVLYDPTAVDEAKLVAAIEKGCYKVASTE
ncbi:MAG: cation transporter [Betaproteobacteria bacterium]|nr:cation transporter [Betaproteobacteria bacterium]MDH3435910.1 cation transporter [Betaproteobacteria bacterium]